jgi:hypothetical protein
MPDLDGGAPPARTPWRAALPWVPFAALLLTLICCDLNVNPILDEEQWLQSGLATAHNHFLKTGLVSGSLYGLVLGVLFGAFYLVGALIGAFSGVLDFVSWFLSHQGTFYFIARMLTAGIAVGGLVLLARTLAPRVGGLAASTLAVGFAFAAPAVDRIAYATPHASMIGYSAALIAVLLRARESGSRLWWAAAGAVVAAALSTMTIGLGLGLLAFWGAVAPIPGGGGPSRGRRLADVLTGFTAGFVLFGYPILLHPQQYWEQNIRFQVSRQILTHDGGRGLLIHAWLAEGLPLWIAALAGVLRGRFREGRALAVGAVATAIGYTAFLAAVTKSAQISYSLAALPCLAYAASGLIAPLLERPVPLRLLLVALVLGIPAVPALGRVRDRVFVPHPRVIAAARVLATEPPGTTLVIDSWYGPRLFHPRLLLLQYGRVGEEWFRDPVFRASLEARLPREHRAWTVVPYPEELPEPDAAGLQKLGVDGVILSELMMKRQPAWQRLISDGTLQPVPAEEPGSILFYRVRSAR